MLDVAGLAFPPGVCFLQDPRPRPPPHSHLPWLLTAYRSQSRSSQTVVAGGIMGSMLKIGIHRPPCPGVGLVGQVCSLAILLGIQLHTACKARFAGVLSVAQLQWGQCGGSPTSQADAQSCPEFLLSFLHPFNWPSFPSASVLPSVPMGIAVPGKALAINGLSLPVSRLSTQHCLFSFHLSCQFCHPLIP